LRNEFPDVPVNALCSLAEGGERIYAREAIAAGMPLTVALPFSRGLYEQDFSSESSRREFAELCTQAELLELPASSTPSNCWQAAKTISSITSSARASRPTASLRRHCSHCRLSG